MKFSFLTQNIWLKVSAVTLGLLLWLHVATEKVYNYEITLPVQYISVHTGLQMLNKPVDSLTITVEATGKQLLRRQWRSRGLRISAGQLRTGNHMLELTPNNVLLIGDPQGISVQGIIYPVSIPLSLDERVTTSIPVEVSVKPEAAPGFMVTKVSEPHPLRVMVTGPKSQVEKQGTIKTVESSFTSLRDSTSVTMSLKRPEYAGWNIAPDSVTVGLTIEPIEKKLFSRIPVVVFHPSDDVSSRPEAIDIEISGPAHLLSKLEAHRIVASVDYLQRNLISKKSEVTIDCPVGVHATKQSVDSVQFSK